MPGHYLTSGRIIIFFLEEKRVMNYGIKLLKLKRISHIFIEPYCLVITEHHNYDEIF